MITITTDFGYSEYVGAMKGVILTINPESILVDLTHNILPFDIRHGAYALYSTYPFFPKGTVHVVVVDPGVGTERKNLIIESGGHYFVGPDNGVFSLIEAEKIFEITEENTPTTFHGRDIYAPTAAKIERGVDPGELGKQIDSHLKIMKKEVEAGHILKGEVFCIDPFGHIITSITQRSIKLLGLQDGDEVNIRLGERRLKVPWVRTYGELKKGVLGIIINSAGHLEITLREGNANHQLGSRGGDAVEVHP
jgi:S-adenosylmethionine hydrolase